MHDNEVTVDKQIAKKMAVGCTVQAACVCVCVLGVNLSLSYFIHEVFVDERPILMSSLHHRSITTKLHGPRIPFKKIWIYPGNILTPPPPKSYLESESTYKSVSMHLRPPEYVIYPS